VRDLRRLKHRRKLQEQKIEADQNSLPDVTSLTTFASDAQRAADGARRAAEEAQRAAETAKKAVEDAEGKYAQLAADKLDLAKLTEESGLLRAQLGID
jgi:membrane protein involved in colicin uptake